MDTGYFYILTPVNTTTVNMGVHISFQISMFVSLDIPRSEIAGS